MIDTAVRVRYNDGYLDEHTKKVVRRAILKGVAIPGFQVPFASREVPMPRGWGTGGVQVTAALIGADDRLKVIDQGADDTTNAVSIRQFFERTAEVETTTNTAAATIIQTRHRIPETPLREGQILVYQVPLPEPLAKLEPRISETRRLHALSEYGLMYVKLYEDIARFGHIATTYDYPVLVAGRYIMSPSPTPSFDNPKMHQSPVLQLFGAGREKRIYAVPPYTDVESLGFDDYPFERQVFDRPCAICGADGVYLDEVITNNDGDAMFVCSDTDYCERVQAGTARPLAAVKVHSAAKTAAAPPAVPVAASASTDPAPLLSVQGAGHLYGDRIGCEDVSFDIWPGEVLAVVGESGSGKTTLLQMLAQRLSTDSGRILYRGRDDRLLDLASLTEREVRALWRGDWGFIHQDAAAGLRMRVSAGGNVGEPLMAAGWRNYAQIRQAASTWLERVEIPSGRIDETPETFSGGMRQRVQIARNLVSNPRLVFMDEPTSGLDVSVQARLLDSLRSLVAGLGLAVVIVTHDLAVARLLSHRMLVMQSGRVIEQGLTDRVLDDPKEPYTQLLVSSILQS